MLATVINNAAVRRGNGHAPPTDKLQETQGSETEISGATKGGQLTADSETCGLGHM